MLVMTGSSGLLGKHLMLDGLVLKPSSRMFDLSSKESIEAYLYDLLTSGNRLDTIVLCGAYTNVAASNDEKDKAFIINAMSPVWIVNSILLNSILTLPRIVYISTDYVFDGTRGNYKVDEPINPVPGNYYAMSKALGEMAIRGYPNHLIIRTSFCRSDVWPYSKAFDDQFTIRDTVDIIAPKISRVINNGATGIVHIGTAKKTVYELAKRINPNVEPISRLTVKSVNIPFDTSLELTC